MSFCRSPSSRCRRGPGGRPLRFGLGALGEISGASDRRRGGTGGISGEAGAGRHHLLARPRRVGRPPTFDFAGSVNLARAEVRFPAPRRIAEPDGSEAFGYSEGVVFPILVQAKNPAQPVTLALNANYAVCEKICLPARAALSLTLPAGAPTPFAAVLRTRAQSCRDMSTRRLSGWKSPRSTRATGRSACPRAQGRRAIYLWNRRRAGGSTLERKRPLGVMIVSRWRFARRPPTPPFPSRCARRSPAAPALWRRT